MPAYVAALCREARGVGASAPTRVQVHTVFFGGGTPSLLPAIQVGLVMGALRESFAVDQGAEITLEANPGTLAPDRLRALHTLGVNRLSLGVQSANGEELRMLERQHNFLDVLQAVSWARHAGFDNLNVDLIYGLPGQKLQTWQTTVTRVLELQPEHISAYALTLEHGTPFGRWSRRGLLDPVDDDLAADMYEWLSDVLSSSGYEQYEISNWARPGRECRHNLQYWRGLPYLGLGAGAHGYAGGYRYSNVLAIQEYVRRFYRTAPKDRSYNLAGERAMAPVAVDRSTYPLSPAAANRHLQTLADDMVEFMIMGLRLTREGVSEKAFLRRFGRRVSDVFGSSIDRLVQLGLLARDRAVAPASLVPDSADGIGSRIRPTGRGRLLGNRIFREFLTPNLAL